MKTSLETPLLPSSFRTQVLSPQCLRVYYGNDSLQYGDIRIPQGSTSAPLIVVVHGGAWLKEYTLDYMNPFCKALTKAGFITWNLEYRRIGDEGGGYPGTFTDIASAMDCIPTLTTLEHLKGRIDFNAIILLGHSAGGHLAVWAGSRSHIPQNHILGAANPLPIRGVVSLAGVLDLQEAFESGLAEGAVRQLLAPYAPDALYPVVSPFAMVPADVPVMIIHGIDDMEVPLSASKAYAQKVRALNGAITCTTVHNTDHFSLTDPYGPAWKEILHAVTTLTGKGT